MSMLATVGKPADRPIIATLLGDSGTGKTTLAATFPKPIFIRAEDGLQAIPAASRPDAFPVVAKPEDMFAQVRALLEEDHQYRTLVIDSVTALERMFVQDVIDRDPKAPKGIQQAFGGYGAGREMVAAMHARLRKGAGLLAERKGMNTVFIAHADTARLEPPDGDPYMRYTLRLHEKSQPSYVDDVDLVGFLRLETITIGEGERKKAISDGSRVLVCHAAAAHVSKNRFGIAEPLAVKQGENPLVQFVPSLQTNIKGK